MFERYTEKARRVIFFARHEASQAGWRRIESDHIFLGLLREDKGGFYRLLQFLPSPPSVEEIREEILSTFPAPEKSEISSVDLPLSEGAKQVLVKAEEESVWLNSRYIGTEHLLLGLLHEEGCVTSKIFSKFMDIENFRAAVCAQLTPMSQPTLDFPSNPIELVNNHLQAIVKKQIDDVIGNYSMSDQTYTFPEGQRWSSLGIEQLADRWKEYRDSPLTLNCYSWVEGPITHLFGNVGWIAGIILFDVSIRNLLIQIQLRCTIIAERKADQTWQINHEHYSQPHPDLYGFGDSQQQKME